MIFCCVFINFENVFDFFWYIGVQNKVLLNDIDGKCFIIIINMYNCIKLKVLVSGRFFDFFEYIVGIR